MDSNRIDKDVYLENIKKELINFLEDKLSQLKHRYYFYDKIDSILFKFYSDFSLSIEFVMIPSLRNMLSEYQILASNDTKALNMIMDEFAGKAVKMMVNELNAVIMEFESKVLETIAIRN